MSGVPVSLTVYNSLADPDLQINRGGAGGGGGVKGGPLPWIRHCNSGH